MQGQQTSRCAPLCPFVLGVFLIDLLSVWRRSDLPGRRVRVIAACSCAIDRSQAPTHGARSIPGKFGGQLERLDCPSADQKNPPTWRTIISPTTATVPPAT